MNKPARLLAIAPCTIFSLLAFVSVCLLLLEVFPRSMLLWWVNIELFSAFRLTYHVLDYLAARSLFLEASVLIAACAFTLLAAKSRNLAALFLLNHLATLLVMVSFFSQIAQSATAGFGGSVYPILDVSFALSDLEPLVLVLVLLGTVGCGATHWMFIRLISLPAVAR